MKYFNTKSVALAAVVLMGYISLQNSSGSYTSNGGRTGASFDNGTCASSSCHTSGSFTPTTTIQLFDGTNAVTTYTSNKAYTLRISTTASGTSSSTRYGFQGVCVKSSNNTNINNWGTMPSQTKTVTISGRTYVSHSTRRSSGIINIPWTSPNVSTGNITFYAAGLVADGNFQRTNDDVATASLTITPASSGCTTPTVTPSLTHIDCYGDKTGAISITTTGGSSPFTFDWTGPNNYSSNSKNISGLEAGSYRLITTATGGCKDTVNVKLSQPNSPITVNITGSTDLCAGNTLAITAMASGGNGSFTYSWTGPASASSNNALMSVTNVGANNAGDYILTVKDVKSCTLKDTTAVKVDSIPKLDSISVDMQSPNTFKFNMHNPRYVNSKTWNFGDGQSDTMSSPIHTYTSNGTYTAQLIISNNCGSDTFTKQVTVGPTNVSSLGRNDHISIAPNPANSRIEIRADQQDVIESISLVTLQGSVVYQQQNLSLSNRMIDVSQYANGMYILHVRTHNGNRLLPVTIQH